MRIIVATTYTIPAFSGGWTTPLDLLGTDHQAMYVTRSFPPVSRNIEGVSVVGAGITGIFRKPFPRMQRYWDGLDRRFFRRELLRNFKSFKADFALCLDPEAGYAALRSGIPYAMRFHSQILKESEGPCFDKLMSEALFKISCQQTNVPGTVEIPHNQDLSRFIYAEAPSPERAILLTSIDDIHEPEIFVEGVMLSKKMKGDIVGTGPEKNRIRAICERTNGRVKCLPPVPRLKIPSLLSNYQIGVATVKQVAPVLYQMKVNAYMASGLYTLAKPWTHISHEAPELVGTFITPEDLAVQFDYLQMNWESTLPIRRKAREWIHEHYSVEIPRKRFNEILTRTFNLSR